MHLEGETCRTQDVAPSVPSFAFCFYRLLCSFFFIFLCCRTYPYARTMSPLSVNSASLGPVDANCTLSSLSLTPEETCTDQLKTYIHREGNRNIQRILNLYSAQKNRAWEKPSIVIPPKLPFLSLLQPLPHC